MHDYGNSSLGEKERLTQWLLVDGISLQETLQSDTVLHSAQTETRPSSHLFERDEQTVLKTYTQV